MNPLFQAHCPQHGYLTKLCDHSYCSILSVAELRRSPDQVVAPFTHSHAAYEFLLPLTPMPIILQGTDVYFGRPGMSIPCRAACATGRRWSNATLRTSVWPSRRTSWCSVCTKRASTARSSGRRLRSRCGCAASCACFRRNFTGGATRRTCDVWRPSSSRS